MHKNLLRIITALLLVTVLCSCSPAETVSGWIDDLTTIIPNDIEAVLANDTTDESHEFNLSEGYVNMLKNGSYHITYHLDDGREVSIVSNGTRWGSSYDEYVSDKKKTDDNGNEIPVPQEHIILSDGIYYWVDDAAQILYKVNPANYDAMPIPIGVSNIKLSKKGETERNGKNVKYEEYTCTEGSITFYYENLIITSIVINQEGNFELNDVTAIDKYYSSSFLALPSSYEIIDAWR